MKKAIDRRIYNQRMIVRALESDVRCPEKFDTEIDRKQEQINNLQSSIDKLADRKINCAEMLKESRSQLAMLVLEKNDVRVQKLLKLTKQIEDAEESLPEVIVTMPEGSVIRIEL